jgi:exopolyphosphatase / guanosine-5'-triphosphate,3'-diphosphate pyrophosphatase
MKKEFRASIDIGSNSVLLLIADISGSNFSQVSSMSAITSLGKELDKNKAFHPESMEATREALGTYVLECDRYEIPREEIIVTATESARVAQNARQFFLEIKDQFGIDVKIITSEGEAYYSAKGVMFNTKFETDVITIMDIGGASTELIKVDSRNFSILETISMPIGAVRASQWLEDDLFVQNLQKSFVDFRLQLDRFQTKELFCIAGTMTSLGSMHLELEEFSDTAVHGLSIRSEDVDSLFKKYSGFTSELFLEKFPFLGKRSASIRGGLHLVYHLSHRLLVKELIISTYGLRFGTILDGKISEEFIYVK